MITKILRLIKFNYLSIIIFFVFTLSVFAQAGYGYVFANPVNYVVKINNVQLKLVQNKDINDILKTAKNLASVVGKINNFFGSDVDKDVNSEECVFKSNKLKNVVLDQFENFMFVFNKKTNLYNLMKKIINFVNMHNMFMVINLAEVVVLSLYDLLIFNQIKKCFIMQNLGNHSKIFLNAILKIFFSIKKEVLV